MIETSMDRAIGRLEGKLDLIIEDQNRARVDRKDQYEKLEDLERMHGVSAEKLNDLTGRIGKVEPVISEINNWRQRGIGVIMFLGMISASFGAAIALAWKKIMLYMSWH